MVPDLSRIFLFTSGLSFVPKVPSAGDWSVHRGGTVYIEGAENINISGCLFDQSGASIVYGGYVYIQCIVHCMY